MQINTFRGPNNATVHDSTDVRDPYRLEPIEDYLSIISPDHAFRSNLAFVCVLVM